MLESFLYVFVPQFIVIDPFASLPLYISFTSGLDNKTKKRIIADAVIYGFIILLIFMIFGRYILEFFGIEIPALMVAGGILIFVVGFEMVREGDKPRGRKSSPPKEDVGIVPLATPMLAGPGAISLIIIQTQKYGYILVGISLAVNFIIVALFFTFAGKIDRILGEKGSRALTRILGLLVAAFAVQYILDGIKIWWGS